MGQPVVHFEVVGKDIDKLKGFYSELAGWTYDQPPEATQEGVPPYALVQRNSDSEIGGGIGVGPEGYEGHVTFYVEVPDVEARRRRVVADVGGHGRRRQHRSELGRVRRLMDEPAFLQPARPMSAIGG